MTGQEALLPTPMIVARSERETRETVTLELHGGGLSFRPGQFNMLYLFGVGEVAISISGRPDQPDRLVHTVRAVGTVTEAICALRPGERLGVRGPFGAGWPLDEARGRDLVILAGGIGLAPLRPAIHHLLAHRADYRRIALLYGARTPDHLLFRDQLEAWSREMTVLTTVDRAAGGWPGHVGVVPALLDRIGLDAASAVALVCGPEVMMRFCARELERLGVGADRIFLSMERNMKCAVGWCGHCQYGPFFICKDGPVLRYDRLAHLLHQREL